MVSLSLEEMLEGSGFRHTFLGDGGLWVYRGKVNEIYIPFSKISGFSYESRDIRVVGEEFSLLVRRGGGYVLERKNL